MFKNNNNNKTKQLFRKETIEHDPSTSKNLQAQFGQYSATLKTKKNIMI